MGYGDHDPIRTYGAAGRPNKVPVQCKCALCNTIVTLNIGNMVLRGSVT